MEMTAVRSLIVSTRDPFSPFSSRPLEHSIKKKIRHTKFVARTASFYGTKCKALKQKLQGKMSHGWISSPREDQTEIEVNSGFGVTCPLSTLGRES